MTADAHDIAALVRAEHLKNGKESSAAYLLREALIRRGESDPWVTSDSRVGHP